MYEITKGLTVKKAAKDGSMFVLGRLQAEVSLDNAVAAVRRLEESLGAAKEEMDKGCFAVCCDNCGAHGPVEMSPDAAKAAWNRRGGAALATVIQARGGM